MMPRRCCAQCQSIADARDARHCALRAARYAVQQRSAVMPFSRLLRRRRAARRASIIDMRVGGLMPFDYADAMPLFRFRHASDAVYAMSI